MPDIKRSTMDSYYRAYKEYLNTLKGVGKFGNLKTSLRNSLKKENDNFSGSIAHREIDLEWVTAIEYAIPYIDKSIREQRRFIAQNEEIVPIEKSKKITTESVRHLAQHTNLIGRVEDDGKVTPKSILNIQREESFDIYENRFLRSLILRAIDFVDRCYKAVKDTPESTVAGIRMERDSSVDNQLFNVALSCDLEYAEETREIDINEDISGLTEFERIIRLRKILSDFLAAPLIRDLAGTPEVRSPITRTNLLTKDQNFKEVLKLWEFFDHYNKIGFTVVVEDNPGKMKPEMQDGIYDAFSMLQFVIKMNLSNGMKAVLEDNYQRENERIEREKKLEEERKEREIKNRITAALIDQKIEYEHKLEEADERRKSELELLNNGWTIKYNGLATKYEEQIAELNKAHSLEIQQINDQHAAEKAELTGRYEGLIAEKDEKYAKDLAEKEASYSKALEDIQKAHAAELATLKAEHEKAVSQLNASYTKEIDELKESYTAKISALENEKAEILSESRQQLAALKDSYESSIAAEIQKAVSKVKAEADARYSKLQKQCDSSTAKLAESKGSLSEAKAEIAQLRAALTESQKKLKKVSSEYKQNAKLSSNREEKHKKNMERLIYRYTRRMEKAEEANRKTIAGLNKQISKLQAELAKCRESNEKPSTTTN